MREAESVFVDTGAWIALALSRDPLHSEARELWERLGTTGARLHTSTHVVVETFTFLDRNAACRPDHASQNPSSKSETMVSAKRLEASSIASSSRSKYSASVASMG